MKTFLLFTFSFLLIAAHGFKTSDDKERSYVSLRPVQSVEAAPILPAISFDYNEIEIPERYLEKVSFFGEMPEEIDNEIATLGRVLFYDKKMSINNTVACGSCHQQANGFAEPKEFSEGFEGMLGGRNAMNISDLDISGYHALLWDDRSTNLEEMVLLPLENGDEMALHSMSWSINYKLLIITRHCLNQLLEQTK